MDSEAKLTEPSAELLGAVARGWRSPENAHKVMDPELASAIAREVAALAAPAGCVVDDELRHAGVLLSCVAFNLAQDKSLGEADRRTLDAARKRWDAANSEKARLTATPAVVGARVMANDRVRIG